MQKFGCFDIESSLIDDGKSEHCYHCKKYPDCFLCPARPDSLDIPDFSEQSFLLGAFYDGEIFSFAYDVEELVRYMSQSHIDIFYAHNADYDIRFLFDFLIDKYTVKSIVKGSKLLKFSCFCKGSKQFEIRDSYALIPISLKAATKAFCDKAFKKDYNIYNITRILDYMEIKKVNSLSNLNDDDVNKLKDYLRLDVISLYECITRFLKLFGVNKLFLTIGGLSFSCLKKECDIKRMENDGRFDWIYRESFFGGRTEVFKRKVLEDLYYYDFNATYQAQMLNEFPYGELFLESNPYEFYDFYIANISVDIPEIYLPPIGFRFGGKLLFPCGKINGWYNSVDISLLDFLHIPYKVNKKYAWNDSGFPFRDYIEKNQKLRLEAELADPPNLGLKTLTKFKGNNAYGKLSEKSKRDEFFITSDNNEYYDKIDESLFTGKECRTCSKKPVCENCKYKRRKMRVEEIENKISNKKYLHITRDTIQRKTTTHIGSFITSYARKALFMEMYNIIQRGGDIYYCDTDSIITNIKCKGDNHALGKLKLVDKIVDGYFAAPKIYAYKNIKDEIVVKSKGTSDILYEEVADFVNKNKDIQTFNIRISKQKGIYKGLHNAKETYKQTYRINASNEQKRVMLDELNDSIPIRI